MNRPLQSIFLFRVACIIVFVTVLGGNEVARAQEHGVVKPATQSSFVPKVSPKRFTSSRSFRQDELVQDKDAMEKQDRELEDLIVVEEQEGQVPDTSKPVQRYWPQKSIYAIKVDIREPNKVVPRNRALDLIFTSWNDWTTFQPSQKVFAWTAPNIKYQPLYYEDVALERYGQARGPVRQFASSSVHFFKSAVFLPYAMLVDHPYSCDYPLGYCRPGNVVPATIQKHCYGWPRR